MDCPLCTTDAITHLMPGSGPADAEVMVVGQGPGGKEDLAGRPFVGRAGQLLRLMLRDAGFDPDAIYFTNATRCRLPGDRKPTPAEIKTFRPMLRDEIHAVRPKVIIAVGDSALSSLLKKGGLKDKRGQDYPLHADFDYDCPVYVTYHPAFVLRVPMARDTVVADLRKARDRNRPDDEVQWARFPDDTPEPWRLSTDVLAWDIETDYRETGGDNITQVALAMDDGYVLVDPTIVLGARALSRPLNDVGTYVTHNGWAFDVPVMRKHGWVNTPWGRDTLVMAYLDDETQPQGLEALCVKYLGVKGWKDAKDAPVGSDEFALYNARDALYTRRLYNILLERLGPRIKIADKLILPAHIALSKATERGIWIDLKEVEKVEAEIDEELEAVKESLEPYGIENPNSTAQVIAALQADGYTLTELTPAGKPSVGKLVLQQLAGDLPDLMSRWRKANKSKTAYVNPYKKAAREGDGRIHAPVKLWRTTTGRSAARYQQLDRRFKGMYSAPPGKVRISADYSAIEFRLAAWVAGEESILKRYRKDPDWDPHLYFASIFYGKPESEVTKEERQIAKSANFSQLYMGGATTLMVYAAKQGLHLSLPECAAIHRAWHRAFPQFRGLYQRVSAEIRAKGYVETATGRRRHFGDVRLMNQMQLGEAQREGTNMLVQSLAADLGYAALGELDNRYVPITDFVHDSIAAEVWDDPATIFQTKAVMESAMTQWAPTFLRVEFGADLSRIPLTVEFSETRSS